MIVVRIVLWILFALLLLVCFALALKISIRLKYDQEKSVIIGIWLFRINLTKLKKKREKRRKKKPKVSKLSDVLPVSAEDKKSIAQVNEKSIDSENCDTKEKNNEEQTGSRKVFQMIKALPKEKKLTEKLTLVMNILLQTAQSFSKYATIRLRKFSVIVSCDTAADTAILFGIANSLVSSMLGICDSFRVFKTETGAVSVYQDYLSGKSTLILDISLSMRVFQVLLCLLPTLKTFIKNNNTKSSSKEKKS